jgi:cytochrome c
MKRLGLLVVLVLFSSWQSALAVPPAASAMKQLDSAKACDLCHRDAPAKPRVGEPLPLAPSWKDIARKYKGQKDTEDRLTEIVLSGSRGGGMEHHWQGKMSDVGMLPNAKEIDEDQARQLVHWILAFAR